MDYYIAPSLLSADFGRLAEEVSAVEKAGADLIHLDVMDGRFVPNITIGPSVVAAVKRYAKVPLDVHLMIVEPERSLEAFADAGADVITIHPEATTHLQRALARVRELGKKVGVSLNPGLTVMRSTMSTSVRTHSMAERGVDGFRETPTFFPSSRTRASAR